MSDLTQYCTRMQTDQHIRVWNWDMDAVPRGRRISLTRRCYLDQVIHRAQLQRRLSQGDVDVLDFWFGMTTGYGRVCSNSGIAVPMVSKSSRWSGHSRSSRNDWMAGALQ